MKCLIGEQGQLGDGRLVAVKRLGRGSRQGGKEFANEAKLLSCLQHKNVVNLYGYCAHAEDKLLVYEYVANESLDKLLFSGKSPPLFVLYPDAICDILNLDRKKIIFIGFKCMQFTCICF